MPIDLQSFKKQYSSRIRDSFRSKGLRGMLEDLNKVLDDQMSMKREDQKTAEARAYADQTRTQTQEFQTSERIAGEKAIADRQVADDLRAQQVKQAEADKLKAQQEELAAWTKQGQDAAVMIYADPTNPDVYRDSMAAIAEANQQIVARGGTPIDLNGVTTQARMLRDELRTVSESKKMAMTDRALQDVYDAFDEWGDATGEDKVVAGEKLHKAGIRYQLAIKNDETIGQIVNLFQPEPEEGLSVTESQKQTTLIQTALANNPKLMDQIPGSAAIHPDSAALANRIITEVGPNVPRKDVARRVDEVRQSFLKTKRSAKDVIVGGGGMELEPAHEGPEGPKPSKPGPAQRSYPEDKVVEAWVAVMGNVLPAKRDMALSKVPASLRQKVKDKLGW